MRTVVCDGLPVEVEAAGEGPPLLLVHGALADARIWRPHLAILAATHRVIAPSLWHFGPEAAAVKVPPFGTATHAAQLIGLVEALAVGPVSMVAWSYSAHAALLAALERPEFFRALLIHEPGVASYVEEPAQRARCEESANAVFGPVFAAMAESGPEAAARTLIDATGGEGAFARQSEELRAIEHDNVHTMVSLLNQQPPPDISASDLRALRVPVSVAWGARSPAMFQIVSSAAAEMIGGTAHRCIADAGHLWPLEDVEGFVAWVKQPAV